MNTLEMSAIACEQALGLGVWVFVGGRGWGEGKEREKVSDPGGSSQQILYNYEVTKQAMLTVQMRIVK